MEPEEKETGSSAATSVRSRCPFISDPLEDCFCYEMTSLTVKRAMYYCGGSFEECEIYKKRLASSDFLPLQSAEQQKLN